MFGYRNSKYDAAPVNFYREAKQRYEEVKPIRGRSGDVRPIGKRSRDHECIVKVSDTAYAIRLYGTNVVTYHEDGSVELCTGGYPSVSTAEMIELHGPFYTAKRSRNVWAWNRYGNTDQNLKAEKYLVPADGTPVKFVRRDGRYVPETPQIIKQRGRQNWHQRVESADQTFSRLRKSNAKSKRGLVALEHNVRPWWRKA
jgi:hypothetical protein